MSSPAPVVPDAAAPAAADAPVTPPAAEAPPVVDATDWKAMARKHENAEKALQAKLKAIEDRDLSELDKYKRDAADAATRLAELQRENTFLAKGFTSDLVPPVNASPEELSAYADRLLAWRGAVPAAVPAPVPGVPQPRPDLAQGQQGIDPGSADEAEFKQHEQFLFPNKRK